MKNKRIKFIVIILLLVSLAFLLNLKVTTKQGINYQVSSLKIPLYLKLLDFFDRHYNYISLVGRITEGSMNKEEKVLALFNWCYVNIKDQPATLSVVDDHVWHIIIRGYGAGEQSSDVFTTLCNYAGADAFYLWIGNGQSNRKLPFSFVKINQAWIVFDVLNGVYFKNNQGNLASLKDIVNNDFIAQAIDPLKKISIDYKQYSDNFPDAASLGGRLERSNIQSPFKRLIFQIERWGKKK